MNDYCDKQQELKTISSKLFITISFLYNLLIISFIIIFIEYVIENNIEDFLAIYVFILVIPINDAILLRFGKEAKSSSCLYVSCNFAISQVLFVCAIKINESSFGDSLIISIYLIIISICNFTLFSIYIIYAFRFRKSLINSIDV